jgi:AraC family transcriptional regulator
MGLRMRGVRKFPPTSDLLASSARLGWPSLSAELRTHGPTEIPKLVPQHVEVCMVLAGDGAGSVRRTVAGYDQEAAPRPGAIWLSPAGVGKEMVITAPIARTLHLYLPAAPFERLKSDFKLPVMPTHSIHHAAGIEDDLILQIGHSVLAELTAETAAGRMYVETAALMLAARLLQKHCDSGTSAPTESFTHGLDQIRLRRVLDYIAINLEDDITLQDLAAVAGYSPFHFSRMFALATGAPPHRYISRIRLEKSMVELTERKLSLTEIALNAHFSSQTSFARAFHRATGMTPKEYQHRRR